MAVLPLAIAAPLAYSIMDGQQNADRLRAERDSTALAAAIGTRIDRTQQEVVRTADSQILTGLFTSPVKTSTTTARATLLTLGTSADDGVRNVIVQDADGSVRLWVSGGKAASGTPRLPTEDDVLPAALSLEDGSAYQSAANSTAWSEVHAGEDGGFQAVDASNPAAVVSYSLGNNFGSMGAGARSSRIRPRTPSR